MKPILIDDLIYDQELSNTSGEFTVNVDGTDFKGWHIAKPLNYDPDYLSKKERKEMADAIMAGKAIAICFFEDLTLEEQTEYVREKITINEENTQDDGKTLTNN